MQNNNKSVLTKRQLDVLTKTIESFIETAEPVGSKWLSGTGGIDASPATIRNELSELEAEGYLSHRHQSSGRVPTDRGYRLYVDHLADLMATSTHSSLTEDTTHALPVDLIRDRAPYIGQAVGALLKEITELVVTLFDYTAIVIPPDIHQATLELAHLVLIDIDRVLVIVMNSLGTNQEFLMSIQSDVTQEELNAISSLITNKLKGLVLSDVSPQDLADIFMQFPAHRDIVRMVISELKRIKSVLSPPHSINMKGLSNMVRLPEFQDPNLAYRVIATLEETRLMTSVLEKAVQHRDVTVLIGAENQPDGLKECSMVVAPLGQESVNWGTLAIVGPTRMRYKKLLPTIQAIVSKIQAISSSSPHRDTTTPGVSHE